MNARAIALTVLGAAGPATAYFALLAREAGKAGRRAADVAPGGGDSKRRRLTLAAGTFALGALLFVPAWLAEGWVQAGAGLDNRVKDSDLTALLYAFAVAAPLDQGLKVAAVTPVWRSRSFTAPIDGVVYAAAAALGFVTAHNIALLVTRAASPIDLVRVLLAVPAHLFFAAAWGYALGREARGDRARGRRKHLGGRAFTVTWLVATIFNGAYDHIVFARGPTSLIATAPILLAMVATGLLFGRDLQLRSGARSDVGAVRRRLLPSMAPPSLGAVRAALRRTERPVTLSWIGFGVLVTTGVITASLAGAVALGHRVGIDFSAVDRTDASAAAGVAPLVLLGAAALAAFPIAGYLIARASATRTVLEPAISAALAITGTLILLGLAAPIAVVFAMAFAPVAFGLACAGAWVGVRR